MDFFEILQQGADDANKKAGDTPQPEAPSTEQLSGKEAKQRAKAEAREEKLRAKEEQRQAREAEREARAQEREQRRLEREAEAEQFADHDDSEVTEHDDPRDALAALLAGGVVADAVEPQIAAEPAVSPDAVGQVAPSQKVSDPPATPPAEEDIAQKYEWTAPLPAAAAVGATGVAAGAAVAAGTAEPDAASQNFGAEPPVKEPKPKKQRSDEGGKQKLIAWLVVAVIALAAIVVALIFVIPALDGSEKNKPTPSPTQTSESPTPTPSPTQTSESPTPTPSPTNTSDAPKVDPGATSPMDVPFWNVTFAVSTKFGSTQYNITGNTLLIDNAVIQSFPESCAALRTGWGITKSTPPAKNGVVVNGVAYNIAKPAGTCAADMDLYNKVWGLTQAMVNSAKALP